MSLPPLADPERALVLSYAPAARRAALHALWALDEQFAHLVAAAREPTIGLMRLIWWRDALARLDDGAAPAQPLLRALAAEVLPLGVSGERLAMLEEGWSLLVEEGTTDASLGRHAALRGALLFTLAAEVLGGSDERLANAGEGWALTERARHLGEHDARVVLARAAERLEVVGGRWPSPLRPLGALVMLARRDATRGFSEPVAAPARIIRALVHRLTGR